MKLSTSFLAESDSCPVKFGLLVTFIETPGTGFGSVNAPPAADVASVVARMLFRPKAESAVAVVADVRVQFSVSSAFAVCACASSCMPAKSRA